MIDLVTLIARALSAPLSLDEEPEPYWTAERDGDLAEPPSQKAQEVIARALSYRPVAPPKR